MSRKKTLYKRIEKQLEIQKKEKIKDNYLEKNKGYITASKLKTFLRNPQEFWVHYVKGVVKNETKTHFKMWDAIHYLLAYWKDRFEDKYIDKLYKDDLKTKCRQEKIYFSKNDKVDTLKIRLWIENKIMLTKKQKEKILSMYKEACRQDYMEARSERYEKEVAITTEYNWIKLKWTLDRLDLNRAIIRDRKSTYNLWKFEWSIDDYWYKESMAFYYWLAKLEYYKECDLILDVLEKSVPAKSTSFTLSKNVMEEKLNTVIKPWLKALMEFHNKYGTDNIRPAIDPIHWWQIPKKEIQSSDYYDYMLCSLQDQPEFI